jgi:hypothetical protein
MAENDGSNLEIRDGSPELLEELLAGHCTCGTHQAGPHEKPRRPEPQSEAARIFRA